MALIRILKILMEFSPYYFYLPPLFIAIKYSNVDILKEILDHNPDKSFLYNGDTALHFAVRENKLRAALYLVGYDYSINALNKNNETPIQLAQHLKYQQMLEQLESPVSRQKAADLKHVNTRKSRKVIPFKNLPPEQQPQSMKKLLQQQKQQPHPQTQPPQPQPQPQLQQPTEPQYQQSPPPQQQFQSFETDNLQNINSPNLNIQQQQQSQFYSNPIPNQPPIQNNQSINMNQNQFSFHNNQSANLKPNINQSLNSQLQNGAFPSALNPPSALNQPYYYPGIVNQPQSMSINENLVQRDDFSQLQKRVVMLEQVLSQILPKYPNQSLFQPKICSACNSKPGLNICPVCGNSFCHEDFYAHVAKGCKY